MDPIWLRWAKEIQGLAQSGLTFSEDPYDRARYEALRALAAEMMAAGSEAAPEVIAELFSAQTGYATPKVDVRGAVFRGGEILLVREASDGGRWTLPGGWADVNQTAVESVVREVREESGFRVEAVKLAAVLDRTRQGHRPPHPFHVYKLFFLCDLIGGEATTSHETSEVAFFAENAIPADLSLARTTAPQIALMFQHWRDRRLPTAFE